jgi:hypothetical protein
VSAISSSTTAAAPGAGTEPFRQLRAQRGGALGLGLPGARLHVVRTEPALDQLIGVFERTSGQRLGILNTGERGAQRFHAGELLPPAHHLFVVVADDLGEQRQVGFRILR